MSSTKDHSTWKNFSSKILELFSIEISIQNSNSFIVLILKKNFRMEYFCEDDIDDMRVANLLLPEGFDPELFCSNISLHTNCYFSNVLLCCVFTMNGRASIKEFLNRPEEAELKLKYRFFYLCSFLCWVKLTEKKSRSENLLFHSELKSETWRKNNPFSRDLKG